MMCSVKYNTLMLFLECSNKKVAQINDKGVLVEFQQTCHAEDNKWYTVNIFLKHCLCSLKHYCMCYV